MTERDRGSDLAIAAVLCGGIAVVGAATVLLVSPALLVGLLPDGFGDIEPDRMMAGFVGVFSTLAIIVLVLAARRGPVSGLRVALVAALAIVSIGCGLRAFVPDEEAEPIPENTCVAYSGGRHTCPGG
ncbi:hypothetical protein [Actinoplanes sp. NPDC051859]|uniref:hypothetical protein n=1 Tax=Actinoplanes sp. NPDC051859 TaxID=3363909 RepID=UPI0037A016ED